MLDTRYEEYEQHRNGLPFVLNADIKRDWHHLSKETNWHENLEIQFCTKGRGTVWLDGEKYSFGPQDIIVANSNVIHYTGTEDALVYDVLIIGTDFCRQMIGDFNQIHFIPRVKNPGLFDLLIGLKEIYLDVFVPRRTAKLHKMLLEILIELAEHHSVPKTDVSEKNKSYERIKLAILYLRENYQQKITLDEIAEAVFCDKYTLCKDFKKYTGQTVFEHLNRYRCVKGIDFLAEGYTVAETASYCGFDNLSFFAKTFKQHIGRLPSEYKKRN